MLKRTPLYSAHQKLGARLVEFGGWEMPVQYTGIIDEHLAVRAAAGIFDISHMGEILVGGPGAEAFLNSALTNDLAKLPPGQGQYSLMCNEQGGVIDDLYVYRLASDEFLLIINASRIDADVSWLGARLKEQANERIHFENVSDHFGALAIQGPAVAKFIDRCFPAPPQGKKPSELNKNQLLELQMDGATIYLARTGYTGEDGFEILAPAGLIEKIWEDILTAGQPYGLKPAGLGARDTLRTEVCYPLYGHELDENTTPIEAGAGYFVALGKGDFIGRSVLERQKREGVSKKCVAFKMTSKSAPPRPHYAIYSPGPDSRRIGEVVSGTLSPSLGLGIGMGYVPTAFSKPGTLLGIEIRGQQAPAIIVTKPIYRKPV